MVYYGTPPLASAARLSEESEKVLCFVCFGSASSLRFCFGGAFAVYVAFSFSVRAKASQCGPQATLNRRPCSQCTARLCVHEEASYPYYVSALENGMSRLALIITFIIIAIHFSFIGWTAAASLDMVYVCLIGSPRSPVILKLSCLDRDCLRAGLRNVQRSALAPKD